MTGFSKFFESVAKSAKIVAELVNDAGKRTRITDKCRIELKYQIDVNELSILKTFRDAYLDVLNEALSAGLCIDTCKILWFISQNKLLHVSAIDYHEELNTIFQTLTSSNLSIDEFEERAQHDCQEFYYTLSNRYKDNILVAIQDTNRYIQEELQVALKCYQENKALERELQRRKETINNILVRFDDISEQILK